MAGAGILSGGSKNPSSVTTGQDIILAGLFIQIIGFGLFIIVALLFNKRIRAHPTRQSTDRPWQKHLLVLYFVSLLIMIRSVIRVVEYIQGNDGFILSHEAFLYIFDGAVMLIAIGTFNVFHPSELLPGKGSRQRQSSFEEL